MRIKDISTYLVGNPWKNWLFVRLDTDEGVHGIGEGTLGQFSRTIEAAIHEMKHLILGLDIFQVETMVQRMARDVFADGGQIKMCAISAIEMACWDVIGKALGQPIYNLLGGRCRDSARAYANGWYRCPRTSEAFAAKAREVVALGYTAMKFDPFGTAWRKMTRAEEDLSIDIVAAVREAVGPTVDLIVEAHARFGVATAIHIGKRLEPMSPAWYEDPVPHHNPQATTEVARHLEIPIGTGESLSSKQQFVELLRDDAIDVVTMEPLHLGGILGSRKIADLVDAHYGVIVPHSAQGPICTLACLQIDACTPNFYAQEYFDQFNVGWEKDLLTWNPRLIDGCLDLPTTPGLGADLNLEVVKAHPYHEIGDISLWDKDWHYRRESEADH
ncbi:MAG TPA: mandelate racemase/muconate lactonizing enzyme family protein [Terriglobia bacterium]|nr:mandelate racemase/muconate lactonizing enzyme family protein [Terriglobia bacterium]